MAGTVTVQCSQTGESHLQQLLEGLLDWESVKHAFQAEVVELEASGTPLLYRTGVQSGLTRQSFQANDNIEVKVTKRVSTNLLQLGPEPSLPYSEWASSTSTARNS